MLDEPAAPPPEAEPTDLSAGLFQPAPEHRSAVLVLEPDAHWVAEYYPVDEIVDEPGDAAIRVVMRYADPAWLVRLVLGLGRRGAGGRAARARRRGARRAREALAVRRHVQAATGGDEGMDVEMVAWALLVLGVVVMVVLALLIAQARAAAGQGAGRACGRCRAAGGASAAAGGGPRPEGPPRGSSA